MTLPYPQLAAKFAAVGLLLTVVASSYFVILRPFQQWLVTMSETISTERAMAARLTDAAAGIRSRQASAAAVDPLAERGRLLIEADSDTVVAARVQAHVRAIIDGIGTPMRGASADSPPGMRLLSARTTGIAAVANSGGGAMALRTVGVELQLTAKWEHLPVLLTALSTAEPIVVTQAVQIVPSARRSLEPATGSSDDIYDLRLELQAFTAGRQKPGDVAPIGPAAELKEDGLEPRPRR
ncbi:MAG: type II secretion system protein GspM [Hyphomicrobium aestuarii]|nr:type II secretion system protein GspM [Hyphomicrobium aestuarii]